MTPSAGPWSPSPAELDEIADQIMCLEPYHRGTIVPILSALVRSVEERTLREAAKAHCDFCERPHVYDVEPNPNRNGRWWHPVKRDRGEKFACEASWERSRLASLKETRER